MTVSTFDAHPYPIYGARYRVFFPILDADGDPVTAAAALDSERSINSATFADCTNEATELATSTGLYYLDLTSAELTSKITFVRVQTTTTGAKTTPIVLYPVRLSVVRTGTAQAGAASTITLDSGASQVNSFYVGCYVNITNNTPTNVLGQARMITGYVGSTRVATVANAWGTNPSSSSTFEVLATAEWLYRPSNLTLIDGAALSVSTAQLGVNLVNIAGSAVNTAAAQIGANMVSGAAGAITAAVIATDAVDADAIATDAVTEINAATSTALTNIETDTQDIQARLPAALVSGRMSSDAIAISGSTAAADRLEASALTIVSGAAATGTLSTTQMTTDLTEATDSHYNGRIIIWTSGVLTNQATDITAYTATGGLLTFTAVTEAPSDGDTFIII